MKILVTGAAGFIGFHVAKILANNGNDVVGLDNINDYYDQNLKFGRLSQLGIASLKAKEYNTLVESTIPEFSFRFVRMSLEDNMELEKLFSSENFDVVCNLAAQAGVRYSLKNPQSYVSSNVVGFLNILESCKTYGVKHLVYASSSSVYGLSTEIPFETTDPTSTPASIYAATKKSNELMAHTYSHLYKLKTTGLRFFTVYGPWGRPDMAMFLFTKAILENKPIKVFNHGNMERDFTFISDIGVCVAKIIEQTTPPLTEKSPYKIYNIGNSKPVKLLDFIEAIEHELDKKAIYEFMDMQPGDVERTWASVDELKNDFDYNPNTDINYGIAKFVEWYRNYYKV